MHRKAHSFLRRPLLRKSSGTNNLNIQNAIRNNESNLAEQFLRKKDNEATSVALDVRLSSAEVVCVLLFSIVVSAWFNSQSEGAHLHLHFLQNQNKRKLPVLEESSS